MQRLLITLLALIPSVASASALVVEVRDSRGGKVSNAVVYAVPEGKRNNGFRKTAVMDQRNRMFIPYVLPIQTGTAVTFPNSDDISHQVYSFSAAKPFQLPLYKGTPANPVIFDKAGVVTLGCNIHDRMSAYIVVVDTPHFALSEATGRVELPNLPEGKYVVHVWHPRLGESAPAPITIADSRHTLSIVLRR